MLIISLLLPIQFILNPIKWNYFIDFFHNKLTLDGFSNLTSMNIVVSPKKFRTFSSKFSNGTATLRDIFEIDLNNSYSYDFLETITNLSTPITSLIPNKMILMIKNSLDDAIYFAGTYPEFFKMFNISPMHWKSLFMLFKNDFENMTISRCLATLGMNFDIIFNNVNLIFASLNNNADKEKITIELLHRKFNFQPQNSYNEISSILIQLNNDSKIISPRYLSEFIEKSSVYIYSLSNFLFSFINVFASTTFSYLLNVFDFIEIPLRERLIYFRKGIEQLRLAPDNSLFKRLILEKIEFLNELSFYANKFLNNNFQMKQFFVDFLKTDAKRYNQKIQCISHFLNDTSIIDIIDKNSPIGEFLINFVNNSNYLKKDVSLQFLFTSKENYNRALKRIIDFSNENFEIPLFVSIRNSIQLIMNKKSTFEKEFSFDAEKVNKIVSDMKKFTFRQFLRNNGWNEVSEGLTNFGSFLKYLFYLQKRLFPHYQIPLFEKLNKIGGLLTKTETDTSSILDSIDDGFSIIIDVLFNFTQSILNGKEPSEVIHSISPKFLDAEKTINNLLNFEKKTPLSLKNFNDAIAVETDKKPTKKQFTFYDIIPTDKLLVILNGLNSILKEKNDITLNDLRKLTHNSENFFYDLLNFVNKIISMPIIDAIKKLPSQFVVSYLDIESTVDKLKGFMKSIINDETIGIKMFDQIIVTLPPASGNSNSKSILTYALPATACLILAISLLVFIGLKVSYNKDNFERKKYSDSDELNTLEFKDNDALLQDNDSSL